MHTLAFSLVHAIPGTKHPRQQDLTACMLPADTGSIPCAHQPRNNSPQVTQCTVSRNVSLDKFEHHLSTSAVCGAFTRAHSVHACMHDNWSLASICYIISVFGIEWRPGVGFVQCLIVNFEAHDANWTVKFTKILACTDTITYGALTCLNGRCLYKHTLSEHLNSSFICYLITTTHMQFMQHLVLLLVG